MSSASLLFKFMLYFFGLCNGGLSATLCAPNPFSYEKSFTGLISNCSLSVIKDHEPTFMRVLARKFLRLKRWSQKSLLREKITSLKTLHCLTSYYHWNHPHLMCKTLLKKGSLWNFFALWLNKLGIASEINHRLSVLKSFSPSSESMSQQSIEAENPEILPLLNSNDDFYENVSPVGEISAEDIDLILEFSHIFTAEIEKNLEEKSLQAIELLNLLSFSFESLPMIFQLKYFELFELTQKSLRDVETGYADLLLEWSANKVKKMSDGILYEYCSYLPQKIEATLNATQKHQFLFECCAKILYDFTEMISPKTSCYFKNHLFLEKTSLQNPYSNSLAAYLKCFLQEMILNLEKEDVIFSTYPLLLKKVINEILMAEEKDSFILLGY